MGKLIATNNQHPFTPTRGMYVLRTSSDFIRIGCRKMYLNQNAHYKRLWTFALFCIKLQIYVFRKPNDPKFPRWIEKQYGR